MSKTVFRGGLLSGYAGEINVWAGVWVRDMMGVAIPRDPCSGLAIRQSVYEG
jgi:hypothetical protein